MSDLDPQPEIAMREQLLKAATRLFAERGYEGTSLQRIADAVGIRKASLLYHFPSKVALYDAVLGQLLSRWNESLPKLLLAAQTSRDRFEWVIQAGMEFFREDRNRARLLVREMLDRPGHMRKLILTHTQEWVKAICDVLRQGQENGRVRPDLDPEAYIVNVVHLLCGFAAADTTASLMEPSGETDSPVKFERMSTEFMRMARAALFLPRVEAPLVFDEMNET